MRASRRAWLRAGAGAALALHLAWLRGALAAGSVEKGVHRVRGEVRVNGFAAVEGMDIRAGDRIVTGANGETVFVTGRDAILIRANSQVVAEGEPGALLVTGLRILTGAVLSVFAPGEPKRLRTPTAVIGIRGTAVYVEAEEARSYVCTCYGITDIESTADPAVRETVRTTRHDQPRYVMAAGAPQMLTSAPVINHTDDELILLESLTGRVPPFFSYYPTERNLSGY